MEILEFVLEPLFEAVAAVAATLAEFLGSGDWEYSSKVQTLFGNDVWWNSR